MKDKMFMVLLRPSDFDNKVENSKSEVQILFHIRPRTLFLIKTSLILIKCLKNVSMLIVNTNWILYNQLYAICHKSKFISYRRCQFIFL